jgi:hypothetical protein
VNLKNDELFFFQTAANLVNIIENNQIAPLQLPINNFHLLCRFTAAMRQPTPSLASDGDHGKAAV